MGNGFAALLIIFQTGYLLLKTQAIQHSYHSGVKKEKQHEDCRF